jgi:hypothetical protein
MQDNMNNNNNNNQEEDMFTQAFTTQNNPAQVASDAARREYSNILAQSRTRERSIQEGYGDMYQRMRQAALRRRQATPSRGFTGGMAEQQTQALSAAEMQQLGNLGRAREQALREERTGRQSAFSNALIAGQQQADYAQMLNAARVERQTAIENVLNNEAFDDAAKRRLLKQFGLSNSEVDNLLKDLVPNNTGRYVPEGMAATGSTALPFIPENTQFRYQQAEADEILRMSVTRSTKVRMLMDELNLTKEQVEERFGDRLPSS